MGRLPPSPKLMLCVPVPMLSLCSPSPVTCTSSYCRPLPGSALTESVWAVSSMTYSTSLSSSGLSTTCPAAGFLPGRRNSPPTKERQRPRGVTVMLSSRPSGRPVSSAEQPLTSNSESSSPSSPASAMPILYSVTPSASDQLRVYSPAPSERTESSTSSGISVAAPSQGIRKLSPAATTISAANTAKITSALFALSI